MDTKKDHFANKAKEYDKEVKRVGNVSRIADLILKEVNLTKEMSIMDFGSGTGLLLERIASHVGKITAVDISKSMNEVLESKRCNLPCELEISELDLSISNLDKKFDGIISSMTLHHIEDTKALFDKLYNMLDDGASIALADLDTENGSFHTEDTGVYHFGFDRDWIVNIARNTGFKNIKIQTVANIEKSHGKYPIFLLTAKK
ncbi:MAG: class I SAM-dependent methyltransferase [Sulfurovum sp.]|nr:class I SAM-dependent methyltransferase [Sulfurovum sp.]